MISDKKGKYSIFFGKYREGKIEQDKTEISVDKVDIFENFDFYDYSIFNASIGNLKEYFLTNFSQKYPCCKCQISVYYKDDNKYHLIKSDGAVHSKWEKSNIDWLNPQTELMFGNLDSKNANSNFGPNGPTPFQRKLNQLADTKNIDTINENKKKPLNNIVKPVAQNIINDLGNEKVDKALEEIPNLKQDKKFKIKRETSTSLLNNDNDWDRKVQTLIIMLIMRIKIQ